MLNIKNDAKPVSVSQQKRRDTFSIDQTVTNISFVVVTSMTRVILAAKPVARVRAETGPNANEVD